MSCFEFVDGVVESLLDPFVAKMLFLGGMRVEGGVEKGLEKAEGRMEFCGC